MTVKFQKSKILFSQAEKYMPGGVNSPVRAFKAVGLNPVYISKAKGSKIYDEDGNSYIDYVCSWGPLILGHSDRFVISAIKNQAQKGTSFGACCKPEIDMAKLIQAAFPSMELLRFVNSGTEATMSALRLARGYTKKEKIIKFEGCYHGHSDSFLVKAGSGLMTFGIPSSKGVPHYTAKDTIVLPYNDIKAFKNTIRKKAKNIAAVIVEPVAGNMGVVIPDIEFLKTLREETKRKNIVLIFDEVITGFRVSLGGAQDYYKIKPDLTCLGKIIGGGMPVGAYGGGGEIMKEVSPLGAVYQAGTLSGNPLVLAAGIATLKPLFKPDFYKILNEKTSYLVDGIKKIINKHKIEAQINHTASMFTLFFSKKKIAHSKDIKFVDTKKYAIFFKKLLQEKVYFPPSAFEACFVSKSHTQKDIDYTLKAIEEAIK